MTGDEQTREGEDEDDANEIAKDELFHILQNQRRRMVLRYIVNREGPFEMRAIAEQVAAWEHDTTVRELTSDERQRVYIALYQSHLSKLDEVGLIEYQQSRGIVEATDLVEIVKPHIEGTEESEADDAAEEAAPVGPATFMSAGADEDATGATYYAGATALSLAVTAAVWSNMVPSTVLNSVGLALLVIGIFSTTSVAHLWRQRSADDE